MACHPPVIDLLTRHRMCPAAAGGGALGKNHAFCPKQRWAGQEPGSSASNKYGRGLRGGLIELRHPLAEMRPPEHLSPSDTPRSKMPPWTPHPPCTMPEKARGLRAHTCPLLSTYWRSPLHRPPPRCSAAPLLRAFTSSP